VQPPPKKKNCTQIFIPALLCTDDAKPQTCGGDKLRWTSILSAHLLSVDMLTVNSTWLANDDPCLRWRAVNGKQRYAAWTVESLECLSESFLVSQLGPICIHWCDIFQKSVFLSLAGVLCMLKGVFKILSRIKCPPIIFSHFLVVVPFYLLFCVSLSLFFALFLQPRSEGRGSLSPEIKNNNNNIRILHRSPLWRETCACFIVFTFVNKDVFFTIFCFSLIIV